MSSQKEGFLGAFIHYIPELIPFLNNTYKIGGLKVTQFLPNAFNFLHLCSLLEREGHGFKTGLC
jgi:hypothetical protein